MINVIEFLPITQAYTAGQLNRCINIHVMDFTGILYTNQCDEFCPGDAGSTVQTPPCEPQYRPQKHKVAHLVQGIQTGTMYLYIKGRKIIFFYPEDAGSYNISVPDNGLTSLKSRTLQDFFHRQHS
jgi:hypothetical protein